MPVRQHVLLVCGRHDHVRAPCGDKHARTGSAAPRVHLRVVEEWGERTTSVWCVNGDVCENAVLLCVACRVDVRRCMHWGCGGAEVCTVHARAL